MLKNGLKSLLIKPKKHMITKIIFKYSIILLFEKPIISIILILMSIYSGVFIITKIVSNWTSCNHTFENAIDKWIHGWYAN